MNLKCRKCGAEIAFLETKTGKKMPVDINTVNYGDKYFDKEIHVSHFSTCKFADEFRKGK